MLITDTGYITEEYNFFDALAVKLGNDFEIENVKEISDDSAIVITNKGRYYCQSFEKDKGRIYMKVCPII